MTLNSCINIRPQRSLLWDLQPPANVYNEEKKKEEAIASHCALKPITFLNVICDLGGGGRGGTHPHKSEQIRLYRNKARVHRKGHGDERSLRRITFHWERFAEGLRRLRAKTLISLKIPCKNIGFKQEKHFTSPPESRAQAIGNKSHRKDLTLVPKK